MKKIIESILKKGKIFDNDEDVERYSSDYSITTPRRPWMVIRIEDSDELQSIIIKLNEEGVSAYPSSSKIHFYGGTIPRKDDSVILDLSGMNRIHEIDEVNHWVHIEPGVSWEQVQSWLEKRGYRCVMPLLPHRDRSVLMDYLEREQPTLCKFEYSETIASMWVIWGIGERFITGSASINRFRKEGCFSDGVNPQGPGPIDFWRLLQGSQGTLGIVTKGICKIEPIPSISKTIFFSGETLEELISPLYEMGQRYVGFERFLVNDVCLADILGYLELKTNLPNWVIINVLSGLPLGRPEEMVGYQFEYIQNELRRKFPHLRFGERLEGAPDGIEERIPEMLRRPWPADRIYWKHLRKGNCHEVIFMTTLRKTPEFVKLFKDISSQFDYPMEDIGIYIQPVEDMRACQMTFMIPYDQKNGEEFRIIKEMNKRAILEVVKRGGYFNRIYEGVGEVVYSLPRAKGYVEYMRRIKKLFDPNWILSPGKLCF